MKVSSFFFGLALFAFLSLVLGWPFGLMGAAAWFYIGR